jgi:imidazolonepropionase-like amidohydrolase
MRHLTACLTVAALAGALVARTEDAPVRALAITGVTVIDATGAPARPGITVVVTGDRITAVGKSGDVRVPQGARVVDGNGRYLIPGLWDMHVHIVSPSYLPLFLANGVTGVREMHSFFLESTFNMRKAIQEGKTLGPRIVMAGALIDGAKPFWPGSLTATNAEEGRAVVQSLKKRGADFIKVYTKLPRSAYLAIADEAKKVGLPFAGHVPESMSAAEASDLGQASMEHLFGILLACSTDEEKLRREEVESMEKLENTAVWPILGRIQARALDSYNEEKARVLFAKFAKNGSWQDPTFTALRSLFNTDDESRSNDPRLKYMPRSIRSAWNPKTGPFKPSAEESAARKRMYKFASTLVRAMHKAGVPFLAGTDTTNPFVFPGFSLHDELALLVAEGGFTPLQALRAATRDPARFLGREKDLGTVEPGKLADLVMLDADPLADIHNTTKIAAVVANGQLLPRRELDRMLAEVEAANKK